KNLGGEQQYEIRVDFDSWVPDGFGTSDTIVIKDNVLTVVDLKCGRGVQVSAENNTQGILYALGAYNDLGMIYDIKEVRIAIVQPRLDHIDEWVISVEDLLLWGERIKLRAHKALADDAPRIQSEDACRFCIAKPTSTTYKEKTVKILKSDIEDLN